MQGVGVMDIYIKAWFSPWKKATKEEALIFAKALFNLMPSTKDGRRVALINAHHLKGVSFEESELR